MVDHIPAPHPNGAGAAAIVAASAGCLAMGMFTLLAEASSAAKNALTVSIPSGPLSGVTDGAILVWLLLWFGLSRLWSYREVSMTTLGKASAGMIAVALLLTFPPALELLLRK